MFKTERHYRSPRHIKTWADWLPFCDDMINLGFFSTAVVCFEYILTRIHFWGYNDNHWFTRRFSAEMVTGHSMEHRWPRFQTSSGVTRPQRINMLTIQWSRLNMNTRPNQYNNDNSHHEDKTVSRPSHLYEGNHHTRKDRIYIEMGPRPCFLKCCMPWITFSPNWLLFNPMLMGQNQK